MEEIKNKRIIRNNRTLIEITNRQIILLCLTMIYFMILYDFRLYNFLIYLIIMQDQKLILYTYFRSSTAWRVRIALNLKNIPH